MSGIQKRSLELYIHIPFCARKCLYCDFLSFRTLSGVHDQYVDQLLREIDRAGQEWGEYQVDTVFIGGGTPSILEPGRIAQIMDQVRASFQVSPDSEITIEINPGTLVQRKLPVYRQAGVNRVSIGLQSADNEELQNLGRIHSFEEFLKSYQAARMCGFDNINVDLMSGIPGQTLESWKNTLKKVTMLKPEHISAYSLILEEGTPFWDLYAGGADKGHPSDPMRMELRKRDYPPLPDEETEDQIYHLTRTFLTAQGYQRYEISNYARPGFECRHNTGYWTGVEYLGLGLGASSYMQGSRFCCVRDMDAYLAIDFDQEGWQQALYTQSCRLSRKEQMEEFMFLGLRLIRGVSLLDFKAAFGVNLESVYGPVVQRLIREGLLKQEGYQLALTERGLDVSNYAMSQFLLDEI